MKKIKLISLLILVQFSNSFAQNNSNEKIKADIKKNTKIVAEKAGKNVEYVARESGKNIKKISEKTAVGVEKTVKKIDADVKKKKAAKGN
jgi:hypothetical protein